MQCPKCFEPLEAVSYQSIEVHRCTGCKGIWFEMLDAERLAKIAGSEAIDIGDPREGERFDDVRHVDCPACATPMIRMVDGRQPHIWFEACKVCGGVFFDAGEFRDYKERSIFDFFENIFRRERH